ncbi:hypothetical protein DFH29DRAFT_805982, partial [Suillus ampliporus]
FPQVKQAIIKRLKSLCDIGIPLTLVTICAIMIAMISDLAPAIFEQQANDGSKFHCSDSFIRNWLHQSLHWSER